MSICMLFYQNRFTSLLLGLLAALPLVMLLAATLPATPDIVDKNGHLIKENPESLPHSPATCAPDGPAPQNMDMTVDGLLSRLPAGIPPQQIATVRGLLEDAAPRLHKAWTRFSEVCSELEALSFSSNTPPDSLARLGQELSRARKELHRELLRVNNKVKQATGVDPQWGKSYKSPVTKAPDSK